MHSFLVHVHSAEWVWMMLKKMRGKGKGRRKNNKKNTQQGLGERVPIYIYKKQEEGLAKK